MTKERYKMNNLLKLKLMKFYNQIRILIKLLQLKNIDNLKKIKN